jgi:hypothetical protein
LFNLLQTFWWLNQIKFNTLKRKKMKKFKTLFLAMGIIAFVAILASCFGLEAGVMGASISIFDQSRWMASINTMIKNKHGKYLDLGNGIKKYQGPIIIEDYLRIDQELVTSKSSYNFDIVNGTKGGVAPELEKTLDQNDLFYITHLGMYIYEGVRAEMGRSVMQTFASVGGFPNVTAANVQDLELVYNGRLEIKVGSTVFLPGFDVGAMRYVPAIQKGDFIGNSTTNNTTLVPTNHLENEAAFMVGKYLLSQPIMLNGQGSTQISLNLPTFTGAVLTHNSASFANMVCFKPHGFVVKNAAKR